MASNSQFTPRQVLEAGRRAEGDGQRDYAIQFYQHVLAHPASAAEMAEAGDGLRRLETHDQTNKRDPAVAAAQFAPPQQPVTGPPPYQHSPNPSFPALPPPPPAMPAPSLNGGQYSNGNGARQPYPQAQFSVVPAQPATQPTRRPAAPATNNVAAAAKPSRRRKPVEADDETAADVAAPAQHRYRLGRFMASLLSIIGLVAAIAGVTALGANLVLWATKAPNALLSMLATNPVIAVSLLGVACVLILLAQMAKATFDAAARQASAHSPSAD